MTSECNRLIHWMGPKKVIWIPEKNLKNYPSPEQIGMETGVYFLVQHAVHGAWTLGIRRKNLTLDWTQVIVIKEENHV